MNLAVAVETKKHPHNQTDYKVWYLELSEQGSVRGVGVMTREELIQDIFKNYQAFGETRWRCFLKDREKSTPIEIYDFISMNNFENTHFGNLPTLAEFQTTLDALQTNLELRGVA